MASEWRLTASQGRFETYFWGAYTTVSDSKILSHGSGLFIGGGKHDAKKGFVT